MGGAGGRAENGLACMEQEPKYWLSMHRFQSYLKLNKANAEYDVAENCGLHILPLYPVPDEISTDIIIDDHLQLWGYVNSWSACRTAMLQVDNSPVILDSWKLVSTTATPLMVNAGGEAAQRFIDL